MRVSLRRGPDRVVFGVCVVCEVEGGVVVVGGVVVGVVVVVGGVVVVVVVGVVDPELDVGLLVVVSPGRPMSVVESWTLVVKEVVEVTSGPM